MLAFIVNDSVNINPAGSTQVVVSQYGTIAASSEITLYSSTLATIIDELAWATDSSGFVQIRLQPYVGGVLTPLAEPYYDGTGNGGMYPDILKTHGSCMFDFLEYDSTNDRYKLRLKKHLTFANGGAVTVRNTAAVTTFNYAALLMGRQYE